MTEGGDIHGGRTTVVAAEEALSAMWCARGRDLPVDCPRCGANSVALMIGEGCQYRWSCVPCGWSSSWFRVASRKLRIVGGVSVPLGRPYTPKRF
jgi:hypothetical protein